jgi:hypothetical protein
MAEGDEIDPAIVEGEVATERRLEERLAGAAIDENAVP